MDDWALVVGITAYPGLSELSGPERDALEFFKWVTSSKPEGGGVNPDPDPQDPYAGRAKLIISSKCKPPPPYSVFFKAEPTIARIGQVFEEMYYLSEQKRQSGQGRQIGRRLYLYFAGHGLAPADNNQVALLMANSTVGVWNNHISGTGWAEWFYKAGCFEDVLLFMDCCRDYRPAITPNPVFPEALGGNELQKKRFYAYATEWGKKSWERQMEDDGEVHGVFTRTLMRGLWGAACDRFTGEITASTLRGYLKDNMQFFFDPADTLNPNVLKEPRVPDLDGPDILIAQVTQIPTYQISVNLPAEFQNKELQLIYGGGDTLQMLDLGATAGPLNLDLPRGSYTLKIRGQNGPGSSKGFGVKGIGPETDVTPE